MVFVSPQKDKLQGDELNFNWLIREGTEFSLVGAIYGWWTDGFQPLPQSTSEMCSAAPPACLRLSASSSLPARNGRKQDASAAGANRRESTCARVTETQVWELARPGPAGCVQASVLPAPAFTQFLRLVEGRVLPAYESYHKDSERTMHVKRILVTPEGSS